jgi:hypothetical protein
MRRFHRRHDADRLEPVLPNVDDSPSKSLLIEAGWGAHPRPRLELYDLIMDPGEMRNLAEFPDFDDVRAELEQQLHKGWSAPQTRWSAVRYQFRRGVRQRPRSDLGKRAVRGGCGLTVLNLSSGRSGRAWKHAPYKVEGLLD